MNKDLPQRKNTRLLGFDYNSPGAYFITICTQGKRKILSRIIAVGGDVLDAPFGDPPHVELLPHGKIADKYINRLNNFYDDIKVDNYVIMPNHIHIMLIITETGASRTSPPTKQHAKLSRFVSTLKRFCNKEYGQNIWQVSFNDHIIRNHEDYENHLKYILKIQAIGTLMNYIRKSKSPLLQKGGSFVVSYFLKLLNERRTFAFLIFL